MQGKTKLVLKNTAIQGGSQLVTWSLTWVLLILLPRYLGDAAFGKLFFAISYGTIFSMLINLGINTYLVREVSIINPWLEDSHKGGTEKEHLRDLLANTFTMKVILSVVIYGVMSGLIYLLPYDDLTRRAVLIIGASTCLGSLTLAMGSAFQGLQQMLAPNLALILEKLIVTAGCAYLLLTGSSLLPVCWVHLGGAVVSFLVTLVLLFRKVRFGFGWDRKWMRRIFLGSLPFLIWVVFGEIYVRIDVFMLSLMTSDDVVGWYGAAFRLYGALLFLPHVLNTAVFPAMTRMGARAEEGEDFQRATRRLMNMLLFVSVPIAAGTYAVAEPFVILLYGHGPFENSVPCLQLFSVSILLVCVDVLLGSILIAQGREKAWSFMAIAAALFNPLLNLFFIPYTQNVYGNGGIGAAAATLLTEALMMGGALWLLPAGVLSRENLFTFIKAALLSGVMVVGLHMIPLPHAAWMVLAGALFYLVFALLIRVIPREDLAHVRHALGRHG